MPKLKKTKEVVGVIEGNVTTEEFFFGPDTKVTVDPKSKARIVNVPFDFPSGDKGVFIILKIKDEGWYPKKDISSISINFNEN
jgi:hypothetical protein